MEKLNKLILARDKLVADVESYHVLIEDAFEKPAIRSLIAEYKNAMSRAMDKNEDAIQQASKADNLKPLRQPLEKWSNEFVNKQELRMRAQQEALDKMSSDTGPLEPTQGFSAQSPGAVIDTQHEPSAPRSHTSHHSKTSRRHSVASQSVHL